MTFDPTILPMDGMEDLVAELVAFEQEILDAAGTDDLGLELPLLHYTEGSWDEADELY